MQIYKQFYSVQILLFIKKALYKNLIVWSTILKIKLLQQQKTYCRSLFVFDVFVIKNSFI